MNINKITTLQNNNNPAFTKRSYSGASAVYKNLDKDFIQKFKNRGCTQGLIVAIIDRMQLSPNFSQLNIAQISAELEKKLESIISELKSKKGLDRLAVHYELNKRVVDSIKNRLELIQKKNLAIKLYQAGTPLKNISEKVGLALETIRRTLMEKNVNLTKKQLDRQNKVIRLAKSGLTDSEIASQVKLTKNSIYRIRKTENLAANLKDTEKRNLQIVERALQGATKEEVAKEFNLEVRSLESIYRKHNIYRRLKQIRDEKVVMMLKQNISRDIIEKELGISKETIKRICKEFEVNP